MNNEIYSTTDLNLFKGLVANRQLNDSHISYLEKSILEHGWLEGQNMIAFKIGKHLFLGDGYHRSEALKRLCKGDANNVEFRYIIDESVKTQKEAIERMKLFNLKRKNWTMMDYVDLHISLGRKDFVMFKEWKEFYGLAPTTLLAILVGHNPTEAEHKKWRDGVILFPHYDEIKQRLDWIQEMSESFNKAKGKSFVNAFLRYLKHDKFNPKEFISKLKISRNIMQPVHNEAAYKIMIAKVYNYRRQKKVSFTDITGI